MSIQIGQALPNNTLYEFIEEETPGCAIGPNAFQVADMVKGKKIVIFGLPGAYTPTCSAKHVPGFVAQHQALRAKGVDEVWCVAVNDAFVMGAWGKQAGADDKVLMLADGNGDYTRALDLVLDGTGFGLGMRGKRFALIVDNGKVTQAFIEEAGQFKVSSAENVLAHL